MESLRPLLEDLAFWHWWIFGVVLLVVEIAVPGTVFLWMGVSAGAVGVLLLVLPDMAWQFQWIAFAVLSFAAIAAWRLYARRHPAETDQPHLNQRSAQFLGRKLTLTDTLKDGRGQTRIGDSLWTVESEDGSDFVKGARVEVVGTRDTILVVRSANL